MFGRAAFERGHKKRRGVEGGRTREKGCEEDSEKFF